MYADFDYIRDYNIELDYFKCIPSIIRDVYMLYVLWSKNTYSAAHTHLSVHYE